MTEADTSAFAILIKIFPEYSYEQSQGLRYPKRFFILALTVACCLQHFNFTLNGSPT